MCRNLWQRPQPNVALQSYKIQAVFECVKDCLLFLALLSIDIVL